jgi:hypothetical protein
LDSGETDVESQGAPTIVPRTGLPSTNSPAQTWKPHNTQGEPMLNWGIGALQRRRTMGEGQSKLDSAYPSLGRNLSSSAVQFSCDELALLDL